MKEIEAAVVTDITNVPQRRLFCLEQYLFPHRSLKWNESLSFITHFVLSLTQGIVS